MPKTTRSLRDRGSGVAWREDGSMVVAVFGLFSAGIFLAHAVDAYHAQWENSKARYEQDPCGPPTKVRTAVGRWIGAAGSAGTFAKASA